MDSATQPALPALIVDDEAEMRAAIGQWLTLGGFEAIACPTAEAALASVDAGFPGVVITDVRMPGMSGMDLLARVTGIDPDLPVILITAHGDVAMAVEAMRSGAFDFVEKPFDPERLLDRVRRAAATRALVLENRALRRKLSGGSEIERRLIGAAPVMERLREEVLDYAATDASVLITGETGSGKELIAESLHRHSDRRDGPFIAVNCAAIPETLIEAELFGHEAGAFTGANRARAGHFEAAAGGTLFLDEVTSLPIHLQPKLLRVLQEREVTRLGARRAVPLDIRLIAATNESVDAAVEAGRFRRDLLYRLNALTLNAPPLRERGEDVLLLFEVFSRRFAEQYGVAMPTLGPADAAMLATHSWPGNVRELMNLAERAALRARRGEVDLAAMMDGAAPRMADRPRCAALRDQVDAFERSVLDAALRRHKGAIGPVMVELAVPRRTLNEKMQRYGLTRRDYVGAEEDDASP